MYYRIKKIYKRTKILYEYPSHTQTDRQTQIQKHKLDQLEETEQDKIERLTKNIEYLYINFT